jgi:hypothetical protein
MEMDVEGSSCGILYDNMAEFIWMDRREPQSPQSG